MSELKSPKVIMTPVKSKKTCNVKQYTVIKHATTPRSHNVSDSSVSKSKKVVSNISFPPMLSSTNTPVRHGIRTPKNIISIQSVPSETPECYNAVTLETPRKDATKSKLGKISTLNVAVRVRPMNSRELNTVGSTNIISVKDKELSVHAHNSNDPTAEITHRFLYDQVLWSCDSGNDNFTDQQESYLLVASPLLDEAFQGYNACLFAYGQTGSGKSFSMMGPESVFINSIFEPESDVGIIPRFSYDLFARLHTLDESITTTVEISYFEIYNEKIHDLLASSIDATANKNPLKVREHPVLGPYVVDLSVHPVTSYNAMNSWIIAGNKQRACASTVMNDKSSRSHSIFSVVLTLSAPKDREDIVSRRSKISLVDLAGSERIGNISTNEERLRQGVSINRSLLTLGKVIAALADQKRSTHVPYRESVLTWLLRESLGGNSRTCMLATITPASCHLDETLSTLRYASKARTIVNRVRINEDPHDRLIRELRAEVERLRALRQDYERRSLNTSDSIRIQRDDRKLNVSESEKCTLQRLSYSKGTQCTVENIKGELQVKIVDSSMMNNTIQDNIVLKSGDKLVVDGGRSFYIEKSDIVDISDEEENDMNVINTNICEESQDIVDLNNSIAVVERFQNELNLKRKICSTPDMPNNVSPYRSNFLEEIETLLTVVHSPQVSLPYPNNLGSYKKSNFSNSEAIEKYLCQLSDIGKKISGLTKDDGICESLKCLNNAIVNVGYAVKLKRKNKFVKFTCEKD